MDGVLKLAKKLSIDGIVAYASDVSAPTAAYVAESMSLPTNPYKGVMTLTHKDMFRSFLEKFGFPSPRFWRIDSEDNLVKLKEARFPVIVKPTDSSGSKGINQVKDYSELRRAYKLAVKESRSGNVIVEEVIPNEGIQTDGDLFLLDGRCVFDGLCDQLHDLDCAPYTPSALCYPSKQDIKTRRKAICFVENILSKADSIASRN